MTVVAIAILLWFVGSILYFTGWTTGTQTAILGAIATVSVLSWAIKLYPGSFRSRSTPGEGTSGREGR